MANAKQSVSERFESRFVRLGGDQCWEWTGDHTQTGHGRFAISSVRGKRVRVIASRMALAEAGRPSPSPDLLACHHCDNPPCVNPSHLYWGTDSDNTRDATERGRRAIIGDKGKRLTQAQREFIRERRRAGEKIVDLAREYSVNRLTIRRLLAADPRC